MNDNEFYDACVVAALQGIVSKVPLADRNNGDPVDDITYEVCKSADRYAAEMVRVRRDRLNVVEDAKAWEEHIAADTKRRLLVEDFAKQKPLSERYPPKGPDLLQAAMQERQERVGKVLPTGFPPDTHGPVLTTEQSCLVKRWLAPFTQAIKEANESASKSHPYLGLQHEYALQSELYARVLIGDLPHGTMFHYDPSSAVCTVSIQNPVYGHWLKVTTPLVDQFHRPADA
jgi:hypothetical protein